MKPKVVIDYDKIARIRRMINSPEYIRYAIKQLAYEITWIF